MTLREALAGGAASPASSLSPRVAAEVARVNARLNGRGRVLVRPSGTEPLIRILAEAEAPEEAKHLCASIAELVRQEAGSR